MISIVIPLYNKERQIRKTLESVFAQTHTDYEIVIVNDGSTDKSAEVVESINDPRIRLIHQENSGVSAARNRGIEEAKGEYIALLDADDTWESLYLETIVKLIKKYPECKVFATNYRHIDSTGNSFPTVLKKLPFKGDDGILSNYFEVAATSSPPICSICIVATKSAFQSVGGFPIGIKSGEDLLTWARLACRYKIAYSIKPYAIYHLAEGYNYGCEPVRRQDEGDPVGIKLKQLYDENESLIGFKEYLSLWHKMRASVAIRFGDRLETIKESSKALKYNPTNFKVIPFIILALLPNIMQRYIISYKKH